MKKFLEIIKFLIERFSVNDKVTMEKCAEYAEKELKENKKEVTQTAQTEQKKRRGRPRKQREDINA